MKKVLVTGANGQLGRCIQDISEKYKNLCFIFLTREELDIENKEAVAGYFMENSLSYCINTAAYTNVEAAEENRERAFNTNAEAVKILAENCRKNNVTLIHISTDYVFDGKKREPYLETDAVNPLNVYGESKLKGEKNVREICQRYFIIRTSWLYSQYGKNFYTTICRLLAEGKPLEITTEQTGTPTNANDLAEMLLELISIESDAYGLYHFSNSGEATWYDFAEAIAENILPSKIDLIKKTGHFPTNAKRPKNSSLDCTKFTTLFSERQINWNESLKTLNKD